MRTAILVNGVPASGKSTLTARLARDLVAHGVAAVPLGLDTVKEALFEHVGAGDRDHNRMLGRASYRAIFDAIGAFPPSLVPVIDAWHGFQPPRFVREHVERAGIERLVEVWCEVDPALAARRYRARSADRRPGHPPASYADELEVLAAAAGPLASSEGAPDVARLVRLDPLTDDGGGLVAVRAALAP